MGRIIVSEAEAILDKEVRCLDKGFVRLVDYMGGDARIVQAARVSYGNGTKTVREDAALIHYLMENWHTSPFEQVVLTFHCKMPVFVARQWVRHRTARLNEISGRYSEMKNEFYVPDLEHLCHQATDNKQGRSGPLDETVAHMIRTQMMAEQEAVYSNYQTYLKDDLAKETARNNLPLSLYTEWYWQIDLHNLFHFLHLRLDSHAQYEIRVYAQALAECAKAVAPAAYAAFEKYILNAATFTAEDFQLAVGAIVKDRVDTTYLEEHGMRAKDAAKLLGKLSKMGLTKAS